MLRCSNASSSFGEVEASTASSDIKGCAAMMVTDDHCALGCTQLEPKWIRICHVLAAPPHPNECCSPYAPAASAPDIFFDFSEGNLSRKFPQNSSGETSADAHKMIVTQGSLHRKKLRSCKHMLRSQLWICRSCHPKYQLLLPSCVSFRCLLVSSTALLGAGRGVLFDL